MIQELLFDKYPKTLLYFSVGSVKEERSFVMDGETRFLMSECRECIGTEILSNDDLLYGQDDSFYTDDFWDHMYADRSDGHISSWGRVWFTFFTVM